MNRSVRTLAKILCEFPFISCVSPFATICVPISIQPWTHYTAALHAHNRNQRLNTMNMVRDASTHNIFCNLHRREWKKEYALEFCSNSLAYFSWAHSTIAYAIGFFFVFVENCVHCSCHCQCEAMNHHPPSSIVAARVEWQRERERLRSHAYRVQMKVVVNGWGSSWYAPMIWAERSSVFFVSPVEKMKQEQENEGERKIIIKYLGGCF